MYGRASGGYSSRKQGLGPRSNECGEVTKIVQFLRKQWFLMALAAVLALGFTVPGPFLGPANSAPFRNSVVILVLFLMALPLNTADVWRSIKNPMPPLFGSFVNMGVLPLLAWAGSYLLSGQLAIGLIVAAIAPCTLASAAVWTRRAGGNEIVSVLVTLITNGTCFVTAPFWLAVTTGTSAELEIASMVNRLALLVVLPMGAAQLLRQWGSVAETATRLKPVTTVLTQVGILTMVLVGAVRCHANLAGTNWRETVGLGQLLLMVVLAAGVHVIGLVTAYSVSGVLGMTRADRIATAIAGSQKTLMVGLFIAIEYFGGLAILPMVTFHILQLFIDTLVADRWAREASE